MYCKPSVVRYRACKWITYLEIVGILWQVYNSLRDSRSYSRCRWIIHLEIVGILYSIAGVVAGVGG